MKAWEALERDAAALIQGKITPGSGSKSVKGDCRSQTFYLECKQSQKQDASGFTLDLNLDWIETAWNHSKKVGLIPLLALEWGDGTRAILVPNCLCREHLDLLPCELDQHVRESSRRRVVLRPEDAARPLLLELSALTIYEKGWVLLPWGDFLALRREVQPKEQPGALKARLLNKKKK